MRSANAAGTCQICGRAQKIVVDRKGGEVIARHGFSLNGFGGSSRGCDGSRHAPAETGSTSAIDTARGYAESRLAREEADLAKFTAPGYAWEAGDNPALVVNSRRQGVEGGRKWIAFLDERKAAVAGIAERSRAAGLV